MKTYILTGIIAGALAASAAQAAILSPVDELYSGMSAAAIQSDQRANPAAEQYSKYSKGGKQTCSLHEGRNEVDLLYAAYPGDEYVEKAYLSPANQSLVC